MKSEILIVNSIKDGAGLSLSALSIAQVKIKELEASNLSNKTTLIASINSALSTIQTKDADNQIDYSDQNAAEIVAFNNAIGAASTALEADKKTKITNLQSSHTNLAGKVTTAETKISGLESFKQTQEAANSDLSASLSGLQSEMAVVKKKTLANAKEYFFGNYIPTKTNEPASLWNTLDKCIEHEGDVYTLRVDAQSPPSTAGMNMFQYTFYRTVKGDPTSAADFNWIEMGAGQYSALSASMATLSDKVETNNSDANFQYKVTANKEKIISEVKDPVSDQAAAKLKTDVPFKQELMPKIHDSGKWINADGTVSENYAVADKVPAFTSAVSGANTAASNANAAKDAAQAAATNANSKAAEAQGAASAANEKAALANTAAVAANTAKTAADNAAAAAKAAKTAADTAASNANSKANEANLAASNATSAASVANQAKDEILQAKNNGEFSAVRLYVEQTGSFRNGKVVDGVSGKVVLTPKYFVGGVEKTIVGSGKVVKWYKFVANGPDTLKKTVTATGSVDVRLLLSDGEMGTYYFDLNV
ncbi:hypothetical protein [Porphyromonas gulae]|uniref:hypothetical protein n=1 Tax=Porphyromonas gulae TaxID=111105 RepID=UPI0026EB503D|nr:hypothetical protein [Porphyromonas gulae]